MTTSRILRAAAVGITSIGLVAGLSGIAGASSGSITNTGPDSTNKVITKSSLELDVHNHNNISLANSSDQDAYTGRASVSHNTTGGDATSGDAENNNSTDVSVSVTNHTPSLQGSSDCGCAGSGGSIDTTGPDSYNLILTKNSMNVDVHNYNDVSIANSSEQDATSGKASVSGNTTGGDATSGNASNTNETTLSVTISN